MTPEQANRIIEDGIEKAKKIAEEDITIAALFLYNLYTDEVLEALHEESLCDEDDAYFEDIYEEEDEYLEDFYP